MKEMVTENDEKCPFSFNTNPATFKVGDLVSYRVPDPCGEMPFVGELLEVHKDHVILKHHEAPKGDDQPMRGTLEANPVVSKEDAIG